ncbi:MAG: insulinase family protein [Tannerellaceae bacterium]|nr:insulinase family protein [Tannerellaceae bacterium]MCD8263520.1 insulinase family protein [Tannerellaceae bacterium]
MKRFHSLPVVVFTIVLLFTSCSESKYKYESVPNDPLNTRIYTLENGLKVYLSVNKEKPRVQTFVAVRVGAKNDPAETTGLAHYFEHLMFKGTTSFGTTDYEAEKILLDQIEELFETYRYTTDTETRKQLYAQIDSISQEAAKIAIPNEYDKLMTAIGSEGTNAFTSYDQTAYVENIPSNEIENWAMIQGERFRHPVLRLFHTELETVYEEYNMYSTRDMMKVYENVLNGLFPHHPYGTQTVLGTQEHLKNPSITNIKNYFETYYVPNNMAICMVGDLDPDETIKIIDKYFGSMERKELPEFTTAPETPITAPVVKEVVGLEAENISIAYRLPAANTKEAATMEFVDYLLTNGKAGLIDLNLVQKQKVLTGGSFSSPMADYTLFMLYGNPKEGQTLDDVKELLLGQLDILKKGEFEDWLLEAVINNFKLERYYQQQEPRWAAYLLLNAFINNIPWEEQVNKINYQANLTKQDIMDFCNQYLHDNYVVVYKKQGKPDDNKIEKPEITPIPTNRDEESTFLAGIKARTVKPIEPVFVDYKKDMSILKVKDDIELLYTPNTTNPLFSLHYVFDMGNNHDKALGTAFSYLNYLGTSTKSAGEIQSKLYQLACSFGVSATDDRVYVYVNGLNDNFEQAVTLLEERLADAQADVEAYNNLVMDILKQRADDKLDQYSNFNKLRTYAVWGPESPATNILSEAELKSINPQELVDRIKNLFGYQHRILYYGPMAEKEVVNFLNKNHQTADQLKPIPEPKEFTLAETNENNVLLAHYDANQVYMAMINKGVDFNKAMEADREMYNTYFGGGMNSIVFQEMREARGLAYSAWANYSKPSKPARPYHLTAFIATQNDKVKEAVETFESILDDMPESEKAFNLAKESILTNIRITRTLREAILWNYINAQEFDYTADPNKELFEKIPALTLPDVKAFQEKYIKNKPKTYTILGDTKDLDMDYLQQIGNIKILSQEEIFGY